MRHTLSILVDNESGVLSRIAGLFSARGFNIESLNVAPTHEPETSRITLVTSGDEFIIQQIIKRFNNMVNVIKVTDLNEFVRVEREMVLIKVDANNENRSEIFRISEIFRAKIVDISSKTYTLELTGDVDKVNGFIDMLSQFGIKELARTGTVAMARENKKKK